MTIVVKADLFRLAHTAASTELTRYYINGVYIEPAPTGGALLVATNGHRMIVIHDPEGLCTKSAIVKLPRFALAQCKTPKMFTTKRRLVINLEQDSATVEEVTPPNALDVIQALLTAHKVIIDGTFPDWRRVVPQERAQNDGIAPTAFSGK